MEHGYGLHHFHRRKRIYQKHEPYPHPNKWKRLMDRLIYVVGILSPIMTIPQILQVWVEKNAAGVSLVSWFSFLIFSFFWLAYGLMHKEKPIIVMYSCLIVMNAIVVAGVLVYG
jgi:uncharacterized protein with PQ loop repeat